MDAAGVRIDAKALGRRLPAKSEGFETAAVSRLHRSNKACFKNNYFAFLVESLRG